MTNKILSIIVPSYNAAEFLDETIPTMIEIENPENLEVIIVNDGSKDNTLEIAKQLQNKYPETVEIIDKENGGHGSTINAGIQKAKGKYFKIVDADDWVETDNLSSLMSYLMQCEDDQIISPYYKVYVDDDSTELEEYSVSQPRKTYQYSDFLKEIRIIPPMHSSVIKTAILRDNAIKIDENCFYVDLEYNTFPMPYINTISYFDKPIYRYRLGRAGQSVSMESYIKNIKMHEKVSYALIDFYNSYQNKTPIEEECLSKLIQDIISIHSGIYLSRPYSRTVKSEFLEYENNVKKRNPLFFRKFRGKKLLLLRKSNYILFYPLSLMMRRKKR